MKKDRAMTEHSASLDVRGTRSVGLGLILVAAVAKLHGGTLMLTDARPGLHTSLLMYSQVAGWPRPQKLRNDRVMCRNGGRTRGHNRFCGGYGA